MLVFREKCLGGGKAMCCTFTASNAFVVAEEDGSLVEHKFVRGANASFVKQKARRSHDGSTVTCLAVRGAQQLVSSDKSGRIILQGGDAPVVESFQERCVNAVCFKSQAREECIVLSAQNRGVMGVTDFNTQETQIKLVGHKLSESITSVLAMEMGHNVLVGTTSTDRSVRVFDVHSNRSIFSAALPTWGYSLAKGAGEWELICGSRDGIVRVFDWRRVDGNGSAVHEFTAHQFGVRATRTSENGSVLATCSSDRTCKIWTLKSDSTYELAHRISAFDEGVSDVCLSKDHNLALVSSYDGNVSVFDLAYKQRRLTQSFAFWSKSIPNDLQSEITKFLW